jgi:hypothetical protein
MVLAKDVMPGSPSMKTKFTIFRGEKSSKNFKNKA